MAGWTLVNSGIIKDNTTLTLNTVGSDFFVAVGNNNGDTNNPPTDSVNGATYNIAVTQNSGAGRSNCQIFYLQAPGTGAAQVFSKSSDFGCLTVLAYSGSTANPLDQTNGAVMNGGTTDQAGSITPGQGNELIIFATSLDDPALGATPTVDSGFGVATFIDGAPGSLYGQCVCVLVQATAAAVNPTLTRATSGTAHDTSAIASFKGAALPASQAPYDPYRNQPMLASILAQHHRPFGWRPNPDHRFRPRKSGLLVRGRGIIVPSGSRKAA